MIWKDPVFIVTVIACVAGVAAAIYAYLPYRASARSTSQRRFIDERGFLNENRARLTRLALEAHEEWMDSRLPGVLTRADWVPDEIVALDALRTDFNWEDGAAHRDPKINRSIQNLLPWKASSRRFDTYSAALGELARPKLYQNLPCYRLLSANFNDGAAKLQVGMTTFFRGIDESEALAHELAKSVHVGRSVKASRLLALPIRKSVGNRFASHDRNIIMSVSALTLRVDDAGTSFFLHSRDSSAVAIAGSLLHLAPSGVFQPTSDDKVVARRDCSPWYTLCREYAEEFLGVEEAQGAAGVALSYDHDEPYASINKAFNERSFRVYVLGLGLDPLTLCPELITVSCISAETFDSVFSDLVTQNDEGYIRGKEMRSGRVVGYDFTDETVTDLITSGRLSPAAHAALSRAWAIRHSLFDEGSH